MNGRRWILVRILVVLAYWPGLASPGSAAQVDAGQATLAEGAGLRVAVSSNALVQQAKSLIGWPRSLRYGFLATWPSYRLSRLVRWMKLGFRIDGPWRSEELALVLSVLDSYGATFGEARFSEIASEAVAAGTDGKADHLRLVRTEGEAASVATSYPTAGEIHINGKLFDDETLAAHYNWSFLKGPYVHSASKIDLRRVIIAHEVGHVVAHGLQAEAEAAGQQGTSIEQVYSRFVSPSLRPHGYGSTRESLATEIGIWALGIGRPPEVRLFRNAFLDRTVEGAAWAETTVPSVMQASAAIAR